MGGQLGIEGIEREMVDRQQQAEARAKERQSLECGDELLTRLDKKKSERVPSLQKATKENVREAGAYRGQCG